MIKVVFPQYTMLDDVLVESEVELSADQILEMVKSYNPIHANYIFQKDGTIIPGIIFAKNDEIIKKEDRYKQLYGDGDELILLAQIKGG